MYYNPNMPPTFTLGRLMIGVTLVGAVCGLVVNYPDAAASALNVLIWACVFSPLIFIWLGVNAKHRRGMVLFLASFAGALIGMRITLFVLDARDLRLGYDASSITGWLAISAIVVASIFLPPGAVLLGESCWQRYRK